MNRNLCAAICLLVVSILAYAPAASAMQLVSIKGLSPGKNSYISAFEIETWGVHIRAVCNIPTGWMVTAGKELNPGGHIIGQASGFMTNLNTGQLDQLADFVLVDDFDANPFRTKTEPPPLQGFVMTGVYGHPEAKERKVALQAANFVFRAAAQCPAPTSN